MKVLIDSNIFLNIINHEPFEKFSIDFLEKVEKKKIDGYMSATQIPEIYRSVFNLQGETAAIVAVGRIRDAFNFVACSEEIAFQAAPIYLKYKTLTKKFSIIDGIIVATALDINADFIVTRDPDFNMVTEVKISKPEEL